MPKKDIHTNEGKCKTVENDTSEDAVEEIKNTAAVSDDGANKKLEINQSPADGVNKKTSSVVNLAADLSKYP